MFPRGCDDADDEEAEGASEEEGEEARRGEWRWSVTWEDDDTSS